MNTNNKDLLKNVSDTDTDTDSDSDSDSNSDSDTDVPMTDADSGQNPSQTSNESSEDFNNRIEAWDDKVRDEAPGVEVDTDLICKSSHNLTLNNYTPTDISSTGGIVDTDSWHDSAEAMVEDSPADSPESMIEDSPTGSPVSFVEDSDSMYSGHNSDTANTLDAISNWKDKRESAPIEDGLKGGKLEQSLNHEYEGLKDKSENNSNKYLNENVTYQDTDDFAELKRSEEEKLLDEKAGYDHTKEMIRTEVFDPEISDSDTSNSVNTSKQPLDVEKSETSVSDSYNPVSTSDESPLDFVLDKQSCEMDLTDYTDDL